MILAVAGETTMTEKDLQEVVGLLMPSNLE